MSKCMSKHMSKHRSKHMSEHMSERMSEHRQMNLGQNEPGSDGISLLQFRFFLERELY